LQKGILTTLTALPDTLFKGQVPFEKMITKAFKSDKIRLKAPFKRAMMLVFSQRDETAEIFRDKAGNPEPDPALQF